MPWSVLDPKRILILRVVAQTRSISAAARALGWTPPAVSQHLATLERTLGVPVIHRHRAGVELTEAGQVLVRHADAIARHLGEAREEVRALTRRDTGTVRVGCFASSLHGLIPDVLESLRDGPDTQVEVMLTEAQTQNSMALVRAGKIDLAVVYDHDGLGPDQELGLLRTVPDDLVGVDIGADEMSVVMSPAHPAAASDELALGDLKDAKWIAGCDLCRSFLERCAAKSGFRPRFTHVTHDARVIGALVTTDKSGMTVACVPTTTKLAYPASGVAIRRAVGLPDRRLLAVHRPGADGTPAFRRVLNALAAVTNGKDHDAVAPVA
ncbi:MAG: LysR family transcriptional regulator [Propionibacteriaceae bacterium]|jgi:molybdate transport repressor ModE-like protein|nr:LysR family transcriptional regulator [Propionibacteriaceae bacterium]